MFWHYHFFWLSINRGQTSKLNNNNNDNNIMKLIFKQEFRLIQYLMLSTTCSDQSKQKKEDKNVEI